MTVVTKLFPGTDDAVGTGVREGSPEGSPTAGGRALGEVKSDGTQSWEAWGADEEPEAESPVPAGELLGGKYSVEHVFAEGGMGIVCLGRHVQLDQPVAIKFLRRALSGRPAIVQRFLNEARALAALRSEHVVRVMDVGQVESGRPYLVMEHLEGMHLEALLDRDGRLPVEQAIGYVLQVCEALGEAHALGIVHRDIKPENLFLWTGGPNQQTIKVLDFGLAKQLDSSKALAVTGPQDSLGSPCYMSPEQVSTPQLIDSRTDIWSLGIVLYRLLTNELPFDGESLVETLSHILTATPVRMSELVPSLDSDLDAIVNNCLERDPAVRYQTMAQLASALNGYLATRRRRELEAASAPIRIAGLRSRWPRVLVASALLVGAGLYVGDRLGRIRVRDFSDGWLTPARLSADGAPRPLRSTLAQRPLEHRVSTLQAVPEREAAPSQPAPLASTPAPLAATPAPLASTPAPLTAADIARKEAAYRDYLKSQGLTRLGDAEP